MGTSTSATPDRSHGGPTGPVPAIEVVGELVARDEELLTTDALMVAARLHERIDAARADFAANGCPVWLRMSGGGLVPQGPGILNVSLAYAVPKGAATWMEAVYLHLCEVIAAGLRQVDVETHWQAVEGSFCDGRYNLAWGPCDRARKIAGTARWFGSMGMRPPLVQAWVASLAAGSLHPVARALANLGQEIGRAHV